MSNFETLPALDGDYALTGEQTAKYQNDGHICLRGLASEAEVQAFREPIGELVMQSAAAKKPLHERDTYGKAFIQVTNLWQRSEAVARFVLARRFAKAAAELMGVSSVRVYHDQGLFKEPGGGHTPWHQDQIYWPFDTDKTITMWMPLVPISADMGSMTFASGSHKLGYLSKMVISDESHRTLGEFIENKGYEQLTYGAMAAGDATFHAGWTLHSAPGNSTDRTREVMTIIYHAGDAIIAEPDSNARRNDLRVWFPGLKPGDVAASPLNPLVYSRE